MLILCTMCLMSVSCRSHNVPRIAQIDTDRYESHFLQRVDTVVVRDSVFVREVMKGDTVYLTRVEWRDRWRTRMVHDTIVRTDSIVQVIEHPPERYVPKFYRWCTIALWAIGILALGYGLLRWRVKWLRVGSG